MCVCVHAHPRKPRRAGEGEGQVFVTIVVCLIEGSSIFSLKQNSLPLRQVLQVPKLQKIHVESTSKKLSTVKKILSSFYGQTIEQIDKSDLSKYAFCDNMFIPTIFSYS